jgi:hypothetical protein
MFSAGDSSHINVWSLDDGRMTRSFEAHTGSTTALTWLSHVRMLVSTSLDHTMAVIPLTRQCHEPRLYRR